MNIHCCSFASDSFADNQKIQAKYFYQAGFDTENIHLYNPIMLNKKFFKNQPWASESNRFGWFSFKPLFLVSILEKLKDGEILFYLDVNDKPIVGIKNYIEGFFKKNNKIDILVPLTNHINFTYLSKFNKENFSLELIFSSFFNFQPEAGALVLRNSKKCRSILWTWYYLTLTQSYEFEKYFDNRSRHDQETLFLLSRIYKSIKLESWYIYKLTGKGLRQFIEFEGLRVNN